MPEKSLNDWEEYLRRHMPHIRFLGEVPIRQADHAQIEELIRREIKVGKLKKATARLETRWPAVFIVYLSFKAAYNAERGFWNNVAQALGVEDEHAFFHTDSHWGKVYLRCLQKLNLTRFENVEAGHQFVTRIRLHCGVPAYSLGDFFTHILLPSVQKADLLPKDDAQALSERLNNATVRVFVDDVVWLFFQNSDDAGVRFFSKCRQMARLALNGDPLPPPDELGLRPYVVEAFHQHLTRGNQPKNGKTRRHWKAPVLHFSPYQPPGYQILLPEQAIPLDAAHRRFAWRLIGPNGDEQIHRVRLSPGEVVLTNALERTLEDPWPTLRAVFSAEGEGVPPDLTRTWNFNLLPGPGQIPLMAFRYTDGKPLNISATLPAETCWLLYPANAQVGVGGEARCVEEAMDYWPPWDTWKAAAYDLSQAAWVQVMRGDETLHAPIPVETRFDEPYLSGENILPASLPVDDKWQYIGQPPVLALPNPLNHDIERARKDWQITLEALRDADPGGCWEHPQLARHLSCSPDYPNLVLLPLQNVLSKSPTGTYLITCIGPDQARTTLPFRICPRFEIAGLEPYYLPDPHKGAQPVHFQARLQPGQRLILPDTSGEELQSGLTLTAGKESGLFHLTIASEQSQADFVLEYKLPGKHIRIPTRLAIPRLRWALQLKPGDPLEWQTQPLSRPAAEILQSAAPILHIELPHHCQEELLLALKLVVPDRQANLQSADTQRLRAHQEYLRFELKGFADTLRGQQFEAFLEMRLEWLDPSLGQLLELPLLRLTQALDVKAVWAQIQPDGAWTVHWHEPKPLRHRHLYLWNEWQPWADPVDLPIPDDPAPSDSIDVAGWWMIPIPPDHGLPPSYYRSWFTVVPPWDHSRPSAYPPPNALPIPTIQPQDRLRQIETSLEKHPKRVFVLNFERACLHHSQKNRKGCDEAIHWCLTHWAEATPMYFLAYYRWLGQIGDLNNQAAARMHLYRRESLEKLHGPAIQPAFVREYLADFPQARTVNPEVVASVLKLSRAPAVVRHALEMLLKSEATFPQVLDYILVEMQAHRFAHQDALEILKPRAPQAIAALLACQPSQAQESLLKTLLKASPQPDQIVLRGYWLRSDAGWGTIQSIRTGPGKEECDSYLPGRETPFLEVILRPTQAPERVTIDLANKQLHFVDATQIHLCTKGDCEHFASANLEHLRKGHNHAAHFGQGPAFRPSAGVIHLFHKLEYRADPPPDEFT